MKILRTNTATESDKKLQYQLTRNPNTQKLLDIANGEVVHVKGFCFYDDSKEGEKDKNILTILTEKGVFGTNSKTAMDNMRDVLEFFEEEVDSGDGMPIKVSTSVSKNNRTFILIEYAG